ERAHRDYLQERAEQTRRDGSAPLPEDMQSSGGMPERVKCLHALVAHELARPGANPFGGEALASLPEWWAEGSCVCVAPGGGDTAAADDAAASPQAEDDDIEGTTR
ncbi:DUF501 domain-containing protein, partial [Streptomonospora algeriensis]